MNTEVRKTKVRLVSLQLSCALQVVSPTPPPHTHSFSLIFRIMLTQRWVKWTSVTSLVCFLYVSVCIIIFFHIWLLIKFISLWYLITVEEKTIYFFPRLKFNTAFFFQTNGWLYSIVSALMKIYHGKKSAKISSENYHHYFYFYYYYFARQTVGSKWEIPSPFSVFQKCIFQDESCDISGFQ